ncbi:hypothetical protein R3I94_005802 [Phoxinus phoxinus]
MKFSLFSAVLFSIGWMSVVVTDDSPEQICCLKVTNTRVQVENIVKYEMQDPPLCNVRAVRFYTKMSKVICSDPDSKYAKRIMDILDGRTTAKPTMGYTSTTNTIPTVTTTNKTPGEKTQTSTIEDWVQDYIQSVNKRKTTEQTYQRDSANNYFCLKKEQAKHFCIKQP